MRISLVLFVREKSMLWHPRKPMTAQGDDDLIISRVRAWIVASCRCASEGRS
jgi:hypothetical protein